MKTNIAAQKLMVFVDVFPLPRGHFQVPTVNFRKSFNKTFPLCHSTNLHFKANKHKSPIETPEFQRTKHHHAKNPMNEYDFGLPPTQDASHK